MYINLIDTPGIVGGNSRHHGKFPYETAATYGGTSFKVVGASQVMVLDQLYHYEYRPNNSAENMARNFMNWYGKPSGEGTDFMIYYYNSIIQIK